MTNALDEWKTRLPTFIKDTGESAPGGRIYRINPKGEEGGYTLIDWCFHYDLGSGGLHFPKLPAVLVLGPKGGRVSVTTAEELMLCCRTIDAVWDSLQHVIYSQDSAMSRLSDRHMKRAWGTLEKMESLLSRYRSELEKADDPSVDT